MDTIGKNIAQALVKFQAGIGAIPKNADNPFFKSKYADLASIWEHVQGPLSACELAVTGSATASGKSVTVRTTLIHTSGESLSTDISAEAKDALPQSIGSTLTYLRRYGLSLLLGLVTEDDDGNGGSGRGQQTGGHGEKRPAGKVSSDVEQAKKENLFTALAEEVGEDSERRNVVAEAMKKAGASGRGKADFLALSLPNITNIYNYCMETFKRLERADSGHNSVA